MTGLVDADVLIEISRGRVSKIIEQRLELSRSNHDTLNSPIGDAELWAGAMQNEYELNSGAEAGRLRAVCDLRSDASCIPPSSTFRKHTKRTKNRHCHRPSEEQ